MPPATQATAAIKELGVRMPPLSSPSPPSDGEVVVGTHKERQIPVAV